MSWGTCTLCPYPNYQNVHTLKYTTKHGYEVSSTFLCRTHRIVKRQWLETQGATNIITIHNPAAPSPLNAQRSPLRTARRSTVARQKQVHRIAARDGWSCHWCGRALSYEAVQKNRYKDWENVRYPTLDHYPVRRSEGGSNRDHNIVLACQPCNSGRHAQKKKER